MRCEWSIAMGFYYGNAMLTKLLARLIREEAGGETLEYSVVASLIVLAALGALKSVGAKVVARWTSINSSL